MKTISTKDRVAASQQAADYFGNGYHCAEAVVVSTLAAKGEDPTVAAACATPFGGGFGKTCQEACGALSGGLIAIGHLYGRRAAGDEWDLAARLAATLRQQFIQDYGTTHCATLREKFGPEEQIAQCRKVTKNVTAALLTILADITKRQWTGDGLSCQGDPTGIR